MSHRSLLLLVPTFLVGCSGSFRGTDSGATREVEPATFDVSFDDGSRERAHSLGAVVVITLSLPSADHTLFLDDNTVPRTDRLAVRPSVAIGSPPNEGFSAGESLTPFLISNGMLEASDNGESISVAIALDTLQPIVFPVARFAIAFEVIDDEGGSEDASLVLELLAVDRPNLSILFEQPPPDSSLLGRSLPRDEDGAFIVGESRPFAFVVRATPNPQTGDGFDFGSSPVTLVCDQDLGDPDLGGIPAGVDFGGLVAVDIDPSVDPDTGSVTTGFLFGANAPFLPRPGPYVFTGSIADVAGTRSFETSAFLEVSPATLLDPDVMGIFGFSCGVIGCHDSDTFSQGLDLSTSAAVVETAIGVVANEPQEGSCAPLRITPYEPFESYLFHKILGTHRDDCVLGRGSRMPQIGDPLTEEQIEIVRQWIEQGAFQ